MNKNIVTKKVLIALYGNLDLENDLELDKGVLLRRIDLFNDEEEYFNFRWKERTTCPYDWIIEMDYSYDADNPSEPSSDGVLINSRYIEYALKLYYKNQIGIAAVADDLDQISSSRVSENENTNKTEPFISDMSFESFWAKYKFAYDKKPAAYEYFSQALSYPNRIKSIFFCTSLESIFVPEGERNKKRDFVLQGMSILGFNNSDKDIIKELFELRNAYVHADKKKQIALSSKKFFSWWGKCEETLRKLLFKHVELPW